KITYTRGAGEKLHVRIGEKGGKQIYWVEQGSKVKLFTGFYTLQHKLKTHGWKMANEDRNTNKRMGFLAAAMGGDKSNTGKGKGGGYAAGHDVFTKGKEKDQR